MKFPKVLRRLAAMALVGVNLLIGPSFASVLYQQLPETAALTGIQADASTCAYPESAMVSGPVHIQGLSWWGYYGAGSDPSTDAFVVSINGTAVSGTVSSLADGVDLVRYEFLLSDAAGFAYSGGTLLLELINDSYFVDWRWQGAAGAGDDGARALTISGTRDTSNTVPEPGSLVLTALAIAMLLMMRRRAARD